MTKPNWKQRVTVVVAFVLLIGSAATCLYLQFSNPDMARMRLFLEFWPVILGCVVAALVASWLTRNKWSSKKVSSVRRLERGVDYRLLSDSVPHRPEDPVRCHRCEFYGGLWGCTSATRRIERDGGALQASPYSEECKFWEEHQEEYRDVMPMDWTEHRVKFGRET